MKSPVYPFLITLAALLAISHADGFEGRIAATLIRAGQPTDLLYTAGKEDLRIEKADGKQPHARNLVNLRTGDLTLVFPHNRSFVRLKKAPPARTSDPAPDGNEAPLLPPPPHAAIGMPAVPMMPMAEAPALTATAEKSEILGYACSKFELRQGDGHMEIWATQQLPPFHLWLANQPSHVTPNLIEEQWSGLLRARGLFPLLVVFRLHNGQEHLRFEVKSVTPESIIDPEGVLFAPPSDYREIQPLPVP